MSLRNLFHKTAPGPDSLPPYVREVNDVGGVRILRLQGHIGKETASQGEAYFSAAQQEPEPFNKSLLLDFAGTTGADFSTVAYIVRSVRARLKTGRRVGIINATRELAGEIEIARLTDMLVMFDSEADALRVLDTPA